LTVLTQPYWQSYNPAPDLPRHELPARVDVLVFARVVTG